MMLAALALSLAFTSTPLNANLVVDASRDIVEVSPHLYGLFFEEINCAGDGGLYAEMVRNRGFEDAETPEFWALGQGSGSIHLDRAHPLSTASPTALRVDVGGKAAIQNVGYWGMGVVQGQNYKFSLAVRGSIGEAKVSLVSRTGRTIAEKVFRLGGTEWRRQELTLTPLFTERNAYLQISFNTPGQYWIDMVSLFPEKTFRNRKNGLRRDLGEMLASMNPKFMRFPGGCWVEGETMALSQRWKQTVGALSDRRTQPNIWKYLSTNGLGYHEYLELCEDLGADPLFVINCGMSHREVVPMAKMGEYVQDALDAIEYANGPVTSKWGALRTKNGHPKPFGLKFMEIGNENGGPNYEERYGLMYRAIKAKYPEMNLIACVWGGYPQKSPVEIIDEHYYNNPDFFVRQANRYDRYDRKGPKVYVGEYAVTQGNGNGNLQGALAEAAFMTGMERNSDIVKMCSYAPIFANVNNKVWNPDLIYFDNLRAAGTPSYYVQKMFSTNVASHIWKSQVSNLEIPAKPLPHGGIGVGTWLTQAEFRNVRVTDGNRVLLDSPDGSALKVERGDWTARNGILSQTGNEDGTRAFAGDQAWSTYTLKLQARKTGGAEGFLITVGRKDQGNYIWWNLGGWGNTEHGLEVATNNGKSQLGDHVRGRIETGRWYDIEVRYSPQRIQCLLDGKVMLDEALKGLPPLHAVCGQDAKTGEAVMKVVNVGDEPIDLNIDLSSTGWDAVHGSVEVLTGNNTDENTLDRPTRVAPRKRTIGRTLPKFRYRLDPRSLNVFRISKASR